MTNLEPQVVQKFKKGDNYSRNSDNRTYKIYMILPSSCWLKCLADGERIQVTKFELRKEFTFVPF